MNAELKFSEWLALDEMAARRSFARSLGKFQPQPSTKPVAILTAWRSELLDDAGQPHPDAARRRLNDEANQKLLANIRRRGLSNYPVVGAGQEEDDDGIITMNKENSFVVQPVGQMDEQEFLNHVRELLFNPTGETGSGPFPHTQWGATVRLPSKPQTFLLHHPPGIQPAGPHNYSVESPLGDTAEPRVQQEPGYTQMKFGPRATPAMTDPHDQPDDVGNIGGQPGRRFTIKKGPQP
jgi:hypothetical protein